MAGTKHAARGERKRDQAMMRVLEIR